MKIEVLGPGCAKCKKLYEATRKAVEQAGLDGTVEKIDDINTISQYGVFLTPALVIDGSVVSSGKVLKIDDIVELLTT